MLLVEKAFNLLLRQNAGVAAIVTDRVYNARAPQTLLFPVIVLEVVGRDHVMANDGPCGLRKTRFRVRSAAKQYDVAKLLDEAVRLAADGFRGEVSDNGSPEDTLRVQLIQCVFSVDAYEDGNLTTSGTKTDEIISDYLVTAHEERPSI